MYSKVNSKYKDISNKNPAYIKNGLASNRFMKLEKSKSVNSIIQLNNLLGIKPEYKHLIKTSPIKSNSDTQIDCSKSHLSLHYQYFKSNKNVFCEYFQEPDSFINEPQSVEFKLFNINFCPYCSNEFWQNIGGNV